MKWLSSLNLPHLPNYLMHHTLLISANEECNLNASDLELLPALYP
jgi:hypothetical protein